MALPILLAILLAAASACGALTSSSPQGNGIASAPQALSLAETAGARRGAAAIRPAGPGACAGAGSPTAWSGCQRAAEATLGERAMRIVRVLADEIGPRPTGSEAERRAAAFLADELTSMGYAVEIVPFTYSTRGGRASSQNVVAWDPMEDPTAPLVVIGAHYDTVPVSPGANDNGSGTATTLEIARELAWRPEPGVAVRYVAFGAEEVGLHGSAAYARSLSPGERARLRVMISIDMMAVGEQPAFGGSDPWLLEAMARAESQGYRPVNLSPALRRLSDHASFLDAGLPAILFHWVEDSHYHTALDVSDNVQVESLELMGAIAIELVRVAAR